MVLIVTAQQQHTKAPCAWRLCHPPNEHGLARISIEHTREDVCHPITGYGTETHYAFADLAEEELDTLIGMLETCKSKLKEGN